MLSYIHLITAITLLFSPLIFWTYTPNFFSTPKELLVITATTILMVLMGLNFFKEKKLSLPSFSFSLPLIIFVMSLLGSLISNPEGRPEAISSKASTLIFLVIFAFILNIIKTSELVKKTTTIIIASGIILSLHSLLSLTFLSKSPYLPIYMQNLNFTLTGSYTTTLILIIISAVLIVPRLKSASSNLKVLYYGGLFTTLIATIAIISLMFPDRALSPNLLPFSASWSIALDALKSLRTLLFGVGLSNYTLLYTSVKPLAINSTSLWSALPQSASSELLTLIPTAGITTSLALFFIMIKTALSSNNTPLFGAALIAAIAPIIVPGSLPLYLTLFVLYSLSHPHKPTEISLQPPHHLSLTLFLILIALGLGYSPLKSIYSESLMRKAQLSLESGDTQKVYDLHLQTLKLSPNITNYHLSFADINFRLASSLSQKPDLTDSDREMITRLIQQSIESGKSAIVLRPNDSRSWLTVAKIYQNLINVAEGADNFALETFSRALSLDRANPSLHLEFATLLSQIADTQQSSEATQSLMNRAIAQMQTAIQLKPNYGNAYYNLSKLYEKTNDTQRAIIALESALNYLEPGSSDYSKVISELETLKNKPLPLPSTSPTPNPSAAPPDDSSSLTTPTPLPEPLEGGLLELAE